MGHAPIPHFRPLSPVRHDHKTVIVPRAAANTPHAQPSRAPLAVWIFGAVIAAIVSFRLAPELMARLELPARADQQR
jgi:hypothetical protein